MLKPLACCLLAAVTSISHGMLNHTACRQDNVRSTSCENYIRNYAYGQLVTEAHEVHKNQTQASGSPNPMTYKASNKKDHIVFACHKAVSMNNLVKKVQGRLREQTEFKQDIHRSIDQVLKQYLSCQPGHFGQSTIRK